jgi:DNA-binding NtrC family response regulator
MVISRVPILLVDDEPDVLETLGMVLERAGYAVATAGDAAHALRLADESEANAKMKNVTASGIKVLTNEDTVKSLMVLAPRSRSRTSTTAMVTG